MAVPSANVRATARALSERLHPETPILSVVKGIEEGTHLRMTEVIGQELPGRRLAALSGPNLAREIAAGKPAGFGRRVGRRRADDRAGVSSLG